MCLEAVSKYQTDVLLSVYELKLRVGILANILEGWKKEPELRLGVL